MKKPMMQKLLDFCNRLKKSESEEEKWARVFYREGKMPCCGSEEYYEGPSGGLCTNIKCANCGMRWNVAPAAEFIWRLGK
jgi:hypothetical protein